MLSLLLLLLESDQFAHLMNKTFLAAIRQIEEFIILLVWI